MADVKGLAAYYAQWGWFVPVFVVPLVVLCAAGVAIRVVPPAPSHSPQPAARAAGPALVASGTLLTAVLCVSAYLVFYHEDLVGLDYALITGGRFPTVLIWPDAGRFVPLAFQEFSLLGLVGASAGLFHAFSLLQLAVVLVCAFTLLDATPAWFRCLVLTFLVLVPSLVVSFFGLIYTERDLVFWLAVWLVCLRSVDRGAGALAFCGALVSAQCAIYYKETAFVLVGGFAGSRLLLDAWRNADRLRQRQFVLFAREHALELAQLALCVVFLLTYRVAITPHVTASYAARTDAAGAAGAAFMAHVRSDLLLDALAIAFVSRLVTLRRAGKVVDAFWEPLAAGALAFAFAYIVLGLTRAYYLAPVHVVAVLYIARFGYDALRVQRRVAIAGVVLAVAWVVQQNVRNDAFVIFSRKEYVDGNTRLATFLSEYARASNSSTLTLFVPPAGGFQAMEFGAYLRHKGWRASHDPPRDGSTAFVIKSSHRYPNDICYPRFDFRCAYAPAPLPGELVVLFPGRHVPADELDALRSRARQVFHYSPEPTATERALRALVVGDRLTDRPTDGYVFLYNSPP